MSNPIQDHNDRVAHSTSWDDPPEDNIPDFVQTDFCIPEPINLRCWKCGEKLDNCIVCGEAFNVVDRDEVGCGKFHGKSSNVHICMDCWTGLPEERHKTPPRDLPHDEEAGF